MNYSEAINKFVTCEVHMRGEVKYFAKLDNNAWVNVTDGSLDPVEISPADFVSVLETLESIGALVRFTNHSAA